MAKCSFCGEDVPRDELFKHLNTKHAQEMKEARALKKKGKETTAERKPPATTMNPVQAAIIEFVGEKLQLPMTPALIYGYFCAKRMGFDGNVAEFLTEVIDDFFQARGINYYEEVMKWQEIGKTTIPEGEMRDLQEKVPVTGTDGK